MSANTRGCATSRVTIRTGPRNTLTFMRDQDYRRHMLGLTPEAYRPTLGQMRYSRAQLRFLLQLLAGGRG